MGVHSLCQSFFFLSLLFAVSLCSADDKTFEVVGTTLCADCNLNNFNTPQAFSGLHVTIDCKLKNGETKRFGAGELDSEGKFKVSVPQELVQNGKKLKEECYAQLHSAAAVPCPAHDGVDATKIVFKSQTDSKTTFAPTKHLQFSAALCSSKFLGPYLKHPPLPPHPWLKHLPKPSLPHFVHHWPPLPPLHKPKPPSVPVYKPPVVKPLPPPVPIYKPKPKPPVVIKPLPPPVPIYKPKPKPPVPVYKPKPKPPVVKPLPPPVPIYKPKPEPPVVKPLPPPVPIYKPKPKPPVVKPLPPKKPCPPIKPLPPVYKPPVITKPLPPPIPVHPIPPIIKKPCPPLPKLPPIPKIPPKYSHHPKFGHFPPLPPSIPHLP